MNSLNVCFIVKVKDIYLKKKKLRKFRNCWFDLKPDGKSFISKKNYDFLFVFSEIYDNTFVFLLPNFYNFT